MAAAATDLLQEVGLPGSATTLAGSGYTVGDTSITVEATTNHPTATGYTFAMDVVETDAEGNQVRVEGTYCEFVGVVTSPTTIGSVEKVFGDDQDYAAGATTRVYIPVSSERENRIVEWGTVEHNQDGTHDNTVVALLEGAQTFTGAKTFSTKPVVPDVTWTSEKLNATVAFRATTSQNIPSSAASTNITTYTEVFDVGNNFDPTTGVFTAPYKGIYHLDATVAFTDLNSGTRSGVSINHIGVGDIAEDYASSGGANHDPAASTGVTVELDANDTVRMAAFQDGGTTKGLRVASNFSGHLVGRTT